MPGFDVLEVGFVDEDREDADEEEVGAGRPAGFSAEEDAPAIISSSSFHEEVA